MNIRGKKVFLRAIEENDLEKLHQWANDPETQDTFGTWHFPSSMDFQRMWFSNLKNDQLNQRFAVEAPGLGIIGMATLMNIDWRNNHAVYGLMIGEPGMKGKGYGLDMAMATMRYAFDELHFERLDGAIFEENKRSVDFHCNYLGWKIEGRRKNWYYHKGQYWDQILVGITGQDYQQLINKTRYWD
jgi:RimJ/RimL family protein N-acetyltransferase